MAGITGLSGLPRSGKSYTSIELFVLPSLKEGRMIVTNLPLRMDAITRDFPDSRIEFIPDITVHDWDAVGNGALLILDEVWRLWPQGQKMNSIPKKQLSLLKEHGHRSDENGRSMDVVLISQDMQDICSPVRALIETTVICVKHLDLGREDAFIRYKCRKAARLQDNNEPPQNQLISSENGKYKKEVYQYYKTHMHAANEGAAPDERRIVKSSILGSFRVRAGLTIFALCIVGLIFGGNNVADRYKAQTTRPTQTVTVQTESKPVQTAPVAQVQAVPQKPQVQYSSTWHIAGYINNPAKPHIKPAYILMSQQKAQRLFAADKCKTIDHEPFCEVDGEMVTQFSGRQQASYIEDSKKPPTNEATVEQENPPVKSPS